MIVLRVLGVGAIALIFLLINGGYVYRTKCPLPSGGTQTSWTYGINDILPYIRSTSAPCKSHTGTRLALSAIGISPIHDNYSATQRPSKAERTARELGRLKDRMQAVDLKVAGVPAPNSLTVEAVRQYADQVKVYLPEYDPIRADIVSEQRQAERVDDPDVREAAHLLLKMINQRRNGMTEFVSAVESEPFTQQDAQLIRNYYRAENVTNAQFKAVAERLNKKFG